jgi:hypothetical protein
MILVSFSEHFVVWLAGATIYSREFEKGWVIVNPSNTANASAVPLAARGKLRTHENLHDDPSTLQTVTTISLQAHRAAFVLKAQLPRP